MRSIGVKERCFIALASFALTFSLFQSGMLAQDSAAKPEAKPAAKTRAKPRGRLPAHFAKLVDPSQREKIYKINDEYAPKIEALQAELKALIAKRDAEVEGVLSAEQKEKLTALRTEAAAKREAAAKEKAAKNASEKTDASKASSAGDAKPKAADSASSKKAS